MPITKSAKKSLKRSRFLENRNKQFKLAMKSAIKNIRRAIVSGKTDKNPNELLVVAYSAIDKALKRNIIHKNNAARKKAWVAKAVAKLS